MFRIKGGIDGTTRYTISLVVKRFQLKRGVDFNEIFSQVVKMNTIKIVLGIMAPKDLHLKKLDVKIAFLNGDLEEYIYIAQPEGFPTSGKENMFCKLKKSLYSLIQAPRLLYLKFHRFM